MTEPQPLNNGRARRLSLTLFLAALSAWIAGAKATSSALPAGSGTPAPAGAARVRIHPEALNLQESFVKVASSVKPAVVNIAATRVESIQVVPPEFFFGDPFQDFFGPRGPGRRPRPRTFERRQEGMGSGVIVDPKGFVLTNAHVIEGAREISVSLSSGQSYEGEVVGVDDRTDLAVIKVSALEPLPSAPLGDSNAIQVGEWSMAIGSPFGLSQTVTVGVISAVRQSLPIEGRTYRDLIQTDAAINPGNSGGPLVNIHGEVIGINTAIYAPTGVFSGVGFAIPVNQVRRIMKELIAKGRVVRSWMGVEIAPVNETLARQFGLSTPQGVIVNRVIKGSPAEKAGLERGDVILEFNGKPVKSVDDLQEAVFGTPPRTRVAVRIARDGREKEFRLLTEEMLPGGAFPQAGLAEEKP